MQICQCEHADHLESRGCDQHALFTEHTVYGKYNVCYDCMKARHMILTTEVKMADAWISELNGYEIAKGAIIGSVVKGEFRIVAALGEVGDWAAYRGSKRVSKEQIVFGGVKISEHLATKTFPYLNPKMWRK